MNQLTLDLQPVKPRYRIRETICPTCGNKFFIPKHPRQLYCSLDCRTPKRPILEPTIEEIAGDYRRIVLTQGQFATVDASDFDWLNQWRWLAWFNAGTQSFYALRSGANPHASSPKQVRVAMHREIMKAPLDKLVDHQDHDTLNNRRYNLRIPDTISQSNFNQRVRRDNTSGFKGVSWRRDVQKWQVSINAYGVSRYLGHFVSLSDAHEAYKKAAQELHGEFACW